MLAVWAPLLWATLFLIAIWWLSRRQAFYFLSALYHLTRSQQAAVAAYAIFFLPGTLVHEFSHWFMAQLLGVKTTGFRVLPRLSRKGVIQLGAVDVRGGNVLEHTLIGMAPMLVGGLLTLGLSYILVDTDTLSAAVHDEQFSSVWATARGMFTHPDALILLYLLFTISGSMFLSASDRAPMKQMALYLAAVLLPFYLFGKMPALPESWARVMAEMFGAFAAGLAVALVVHGIITSLLAALYYFTRALFPARPS